MPTSRYDPFTYILKDFKRTFVNHRYKNEPMNYRALILFLTVPFILSLIGSHFEIPLTSTLVNVLLIALSIFAAMLFNVLLLIYDVSHKSEKAQNSIVDPKILKTYIQDTFATVSFSVLISILTIVFLILDSLNIHYGPFDLGLRSVVYYLVTLFVMSLFIDLRRIYVLLQYEMNPS